MGRLILVSIIVGTVVIPLWAARDPRPARGLRRALLSTLAFELLWLCAVLVIYPRV